MTRRVMSTIRCKRSQEQLVLRVQGHILLLTVRSFHDTRIAKTVRRRPAKPIMRRFNSASVLQSRHSSIGRARASYPRDRGSNPLTGSSRYSTVAVQRFGKPQTQVRSLLAAPVGDVAQWHSSGFVIRHLKVQVLSSPPVCNVVGMAE